MRKNLLVAISFLLLLPAGLMAAFSKSHPTEENKVTVQPDNSTLSSAVKEFRSLSKRERKERIKEVKSAIKQFKSDKKAGAEPSTSTLLLVILAILLPPLAVFLHQGEINNKFWISLILTILFFVPGIIYALIVIL